MNPLTGILSHLPPARAYAAVAAAVLAESILLVGAFVPTLTLLLTAGALARTGHISFPLVIAAAAGAVVAGDFLAHRTGRLLGDRMRTGTLGRRLPRAAWHRAETLMTRHGGRAVFLARFLPVVRTLAPHFAGAALLPYRHIAPYSVTAACVWATAETGAGYAAATSAQRVLTLGGPAAALLSLTVLAGALLWRRRHLAAAIAGVLSGRITPPGRLPVQIPGDTAGQPGTYLAPPLALKSDGVSNIDPTPPFPFGHGLSYTAFAIEDARTDADTIPVDGSVTVRATVSNTGPREGTSVPQLYLTDPVASVTRPVRQLIGFARVELAAGERRIVEFRVHADMTGFTGRDLRRRVEPGRVVLTVARSAGDPGQSVEVELHGETRTVDHTRTMTTAVTLLPGRGAGGPPGCPGRRRNHRSRMARP